MRELVLWGDSQHAASHLANTAHPTSHPGTLYSRVLKLKENRLLPEIRLSPATDEMGLSGSTLPLFKDLLDFTGNQEAIDSPSSHR